MASTNEESFLGTAGLLDDADIWITDEARFGFDSDYNDGKTLCFIMEYLTDDGDEGHILLSTGTGWEDKDKGALAVLEETGKPKEKGFSRSCRYHKFLARALDVGAHDTLIERGKAYEASIWHGLGFHVELESEKNPISGEERDVLYPTKFLGVKDEGKTPAKKAPAKKAPAKKDDADDDEKEEKAASGVGAAMKAKLKRLAKECDSHDEFIERAMSEIDGTDDEEVEALIVDEDFYAEVAG